MNTGSVHPWNKGANHTGLPAQAVISSHLGTNHTAVIGPWGAAPALKRRDRLESPAKQVDSATICSFNAPALACEIGLSRPVLYALPFFFFEGTEFSTVPTITTPAFDRPFTMSANPLTRV